ncbi:MAG: hypothetical protein AABX13_00160 [Nanoarchaeota archaeon]
MLLMILFVVACSKTEPGSLTYNFKQGIAEVQLKAFPGSPPEKIYPNTQFKVIVELDNQAAYDVVEGELSLLGLDPKYFLLYPAEQTFPILLGRSFTAPAGEKKFLEFDGTSRELEAGAKEYLSNYFLTLRYNSKVDFVDTICLNSNLYDVYDAGCKVQAKKSYSGQGAPLAITTLEEIITPGASVEFRLQVVNRGRGKVKSATLGAAKLGGQEMTCLFPESGAKMLSFLPEKQEATVICRALLRDQGSYTTTLLAEFSYTYEVVQQQKLKLVK